MEPTAYDGLACFYYQPRETEVLSEPVESHSNLNLVGERKSNINCVHTKDYGINSLLKITIHPHTDYKIHHIIIIHTAQHT